MKNRVYLNFIMAAIIALAGSAVIAGAVNLFLEGSFLVVLVALTVATFVASVFTMPKKALVPMYIGIMTTGASVVTTITIQYVPEYLLITGATTQLTGLKVEILGEDYATIDLDATGLTAVGLHRRMASAAGTYLIPIADGVIKGPTCVITLTNSAAQTPSVYAMGDNVGNNLCLITKQKVLANSNTRFENFGALFCPSLAASTDLATIEMADGLVQIFERSDLFAISGLISAIQAYYIDNLAGRIKSVNLNVAADQTVYKMTWKKTTIAA